MEKRFECLWYTDKKCDNYETEEFRTRQQAISYYENHKNDNDKFNWWITHRGADWEVIGEMTDDKWIEYKK